MSRTLFGFLDVRRLAVTVVDITQMSHAGLSDDVIV
jgi:uncharacterized protein (DUF433 family)